MDERPIDVTLTMDIKKLRSDKKNPSYQPANILMNFPDSTVINEDIRLQMRGVYRKNNCDIASIMLNFKNTSSPKLSPLRKMKLVGNCRNGSGYDELLLKEYMVYKIQNILSNMSFQVRLLHITYKDNRDKIKPYTQYAFLLEDVPDLADRNNCVEIKNDDFLTEATNRDQMTFVNLFQYMIGNTDWSVPKRHNIKLLRSKNDSLSKPYAVPYDYDYSGLVNASYAVPAEGLGIESVRERLYRGFPRTYNELKAVIDGFMEKKERIMYFVEHFELCSSRCRKDVEEYLEEFYKTVSNQKRVESVFISNARLQ
ncbi:MAG: hypothetical protein M3Z56_02490 [Bacteroidota bacterium]|nr:hypothetical protein [Bacteroidota bacterium]